MDKWLEYWQQEELQPDVFTDKQGNKHPALLGFWQRHIASFDTNSSLLDIASGAGAIYRCATDITQYDAHALDISKDALNRLKEDLPSVNTHDQYLNDDSFRHHQFDGVFSQFGIEYLRDTGFSHVPRLMKEGARCIFLCHIKGGVVDSVTEESLKGLQLVEQVNFLGLAEDVANAFHIDIQHQVAKSVELFMQIEPVVANYCANVPNGHHAHLYNGIKQLLSNYNKYGHKAVIEWIDVARQQAAENTERLQSMHNAALDKSDVDRISHALSQQGVEIASAQPFYLRENDPPAAWEIIGVRQN